MALAGTGAIIIWNDITPEGRAEFYEWHLREHIPERVAIPGFRRGSRYRAASPATSPEFLTLYELADPSIATSAAYLARLNAPTGWTKSATAHFRNTSRALTRVVVSAGTGQGGVIGTARFDGSDEGSSRLQQVLVTQAQLASLADLPRITGVHLCATDRDASAGKTAESRDRADIQAAPIGALLIEGCDVAAVEQAIAEVAGLHSGDVAGMAAGVYVLEHMRAAMPG